jgi:hypothetical protein
MNTSLLTDAFELAAYGHVFEDARPDGLKETPGKDEGALRTKTHNSQKKKK